jgi:carboxyl-terminal processing protease
VDGVTFDESTTITEAGLLARGPVGEPAHFVVQRGDEILDFYPVRRARADISVQMLEGDIAYVAQSTFATNTSQEMEGALQELLAQHPRGLIWDLRGNGGGSMQTTQEVLSYFIEDGLLFTAELKGGEREPFMASGDGMATDIPLVVLVDEHTYSSGETAAVAVAERERGTLVGSTTYGKGTINATFPLVENCMLQMTIARWLSPTDQWYGERGVSPDIFVSDDPGTDDDEVLQVGVDIMRQNSAP